MNDNQNKKEFVLKPLCVPFSDYLGAIFGGIAFGYLSINIIISEGYTGPALILIITALTLLTFGIYQYSITPKRIMLTNSVLCVGNNTYSWNDIESVAFTYFSSMHRHVIELTIKKELKVLRIYPFLYRERASLRKSFEEFAVMNGIRIKVEDRGAEDSWM